MADQSELDLEDDLLKLLDNKQCQALHEEMLHALKRAAKSNPKMQELQTSHCSKSELRAFYESVYEEDESLQQQASQIFLSSIQKMQSLKKKSSNDDKSKSVERLTPFCPKWNQSILGKKISIYWPLDNVYYKVSDPYIL